MENQIDEKMENDMDTGIKQGIVGTSISRIVRGHGFRLEATLACILNHHKDHYVHP